MTIETELMALKRRDGLIVVSEVYDWANINRTSEIGRRLEWNDRIAGENWRHWQIRQMIAVHIRDDNGYRRTISLVVDRGKNRGGYREVDEVFNSRQMRDAAIAEALAELDRVQDRYEHLEELAQIWAARDVVRGSARSGSRRRRSGQPEDDNRPAA